MHLSQHIWYTFDERFENPRLKKQLKMRGGTHAFWWVFQCWIRLFHFTLFYLYYFILHFNFICLFHGLQRPVLFPSQRKFYYWVRDFQCSSTTEIMVDKLNLLAPVKKIGRSNDVLERVAFLNLTEQSRKAYLGLRKIKIFFLLIKFSKNKR